MSNDTVLTIALAVCIPLAVIITAAITTFLLWRRCVPFVAAG
jgi:hypothetical protein